MKVNLSDNLWGLYNIFSKTGVMIISHADFKREIERICIQNGDVKSTLHAPKGCGEVLTLNTDYDGKIVKCGEYGDALCKKCREDTLCEICGTEEFDRGHCTKKVTCQDLKLIYNNGKSFLEDTLSEQDIRIEARTWCGPIDTNRGASENQVENIALHFYEKGVKDRQHAPGGKE